MLPLLLLFASQAPSLWQYGYSETLSLDPAQFRPDTYTETVGPIRFWHPAKNNGPGLGYYPYVALNTTRETQIGSKGWAVRPGEIAMEASNIGQYSLVRFTAFDPGEYTVEAHFAGIHFGLSTTDVHVLHNAQSLFEAFIEGYGGDSRFHPIQGLHPTATFKRSLRLAGGDTLTFAVGYGSNKTHYGDTTGVTIKITKPGTAISPPPLVAEPPQVEP
jgi:hypothetical protein